MDTLIHSVQHSLQNGGDLPFSIYRSKGEQQIHNVPLIKPTLICILKGEKHLGITETIVCRAGDFIFLGNSAKTQIRNVPNIDGYLSLLIEFEHQDFADLTLKKNQQPPYCYGAIDTALESCLNQFIEHSSWAPRTLWSLRRKELILLLSHLGYADILSNASNPKISEQIHNIISSKMDENISFHDVCKILATSESTLRRRLNDEGVSFQEIKDQARLGFGLHLLQTSQIPIGLIAEQCGYQSQSRFSDRFKLRFGVTPSQIRLSRMTE